MEAVRFAPNEDVYNDRAVRAFRRRRPPIAQLAASGTCDDVLAQIPEDQLDARVPEIYANMRNINPLLPPISFEAGATTPGAKFTNVCHLKDRLSRMQLQWNGDLSTDGHQTAQEVTYCAWRASAAEHPEAVLHRYLFYLKHGVKCYNAYCFAKNVAKPVYSHELARAADMLDRRQELPPYMSIRIAKWAVWRVELYLRLVMESMPRLLAFEVADSTPRPTGEAGQLPRFARNTRADFDLVDPIHTAEMLLSWAVRMSE